MNQVPPEQQQFLQFQQLQYLQMQQMQQMLHLQQNAGLPCGGEAYNLPMEQLQQIYQSSGMAGLPYEMVQMQGMPSMNSEPLMADALSMQQQDYTKPQLDP